MIALPLSSSTKTTVFRLALAAVLLLGWTADASAVLDSALCRQTRTTTVTGICIPYPGVVCANILTAPLVFFPIVPGELPNNTVFNQEVFVLTNMATLRANKGLVDDACLEAGDAYSCNTVWPACTPSVPGDIHSEGIPALPCASFCQDMWEACSVPFNQFNIGTIQGTKTFDVKDFSFISCPNGQPGVGTFEIGPQPQDIFGERFIRAGGPVPLGYLGQPRTPVSSADYKLLNGTSVNVHCYSPPFPSQAEDISGLVPPADCPFPLKLDTDTGVCFIPCPFPVILESDQASIENGFIAPGALALFFCVFVLLDSMFVIAESQGFNDMLKLRKRFLGGSHNETDNSMSGTGIGTTSGGHRRRSQLRAATLYSLLGAVLGIIFFFIGPLVTIIRKQQVSCGLTPQQIDLGNVARGTADLSDSFCKAQRVAPFLLQMIFNLILYAIVRVFLVVTEKSRHWDSRRKVVFDVLLVSYCAGIPLLFLIIAMTKDRLSTEVIDFINQFSRNSAICVPRLSVGDEVVLIFLPFILSGLFITGLSLYIYMHLSQISKGVADLNGKGNNGKKNSSAVALRLLMIRLSFLGIATFLVLLIFISASATLMNAMANFAPKFNAFFGCEAAKASQCKTCNSETAAMKAATPSSAAFAAQMVAMSSISLLFGGFFAAQSFARLYKEYQDGSLQIKLGNIWHGRPINFKRPNMMESSMQSFSQMQEKVADTKEAVRETCLSLLYGRYKNFRNSLHGRNRGPVFRWNKPGKDGPRKKFDFVPRSWNSKKPKPNDPNWDSAVGVTSNNTDDSSFVTGSSAPAWNGKVAHSDSWSSPTPTLSAWNSSYQPSESLGRTSPIPENGRGASPVHAMYEVDDTDDTPRRPPSRCPSI